MKQILRGLIRLTVPACLIMAGCAADGPSYRNPTTSGSSSSNSAHTHSGLTLYGTVDVGVGYDTKSTTIRSFSE